MRKRLLSKSIEIIYFCSFLFVIVLELETDLDSKVRLDRYLMFYFPP